MQKPTTIKQRLRLSNILSLIVPLAVCIVVALACAAVFLFQLRGGLDLEISDAEDMVALGRMVSEASGAVLESGVEQAALDEIAQSVAGSGREV